MSPTCTLVILLGDGADWIWRGADEHLGGGLEHQILIIKILDSFHAREHLWDYSRSYFDTEIAAQAWAAPLNDRLETDGPGPILAAMAALEAQQPGADPEKVTEHHRYFVNQADRMDYPRYKALGLPIGSGIVEGACDRALARKWSYHKTVVKQRLDAGGMWWNPGGIQSIGTLRALYRSGRARWRAFWAGQPYAAERGRALDTPNGPPTEVA